KLMGVEDATSYAQSLFNDGRAAIIRELSHHKPSGSELGNDANNDALLALIEWLWARKK
ncbi:polyprenyl synthetase family protein, partial [Psychrobacter sp. Ps7]|nr:polyprenyl synthetase family protein [Psychrobacter sp. Ps7]